MEAEPLWSHSENGLCAVREAEALGNFNIGQQVGSTQRIPGDRRVVTPRGPASRRGCVTCAWKDGVSSRGNKEAGSSVSRPEGMKAGLVSSSTQPLPLPENLVHFHGFFLQTMLQSTLFNPVFSGTQIHPTALSTSLQDASQACQASKVPLPKDSISCSHWFRTWYHHPSSCQKPEY